MEETNTNTAKAAEHIRTGDELLAEFDLKGAYTEYGEAAKLAPSAENYLRCGVVLFKIAKYREAIGQHRKALRLDRNFVSAYVGWGDALAALNKHARAIRKYAKALSLAPGDTKSADIHFSWGKVLARQQEHQKAIQKYTEALDLDANHRKAREHLAISLYKLGEFRDAMQEQLKTLESGVTKFNFELWVNILDELVEVERCSASEEFGKAIAGTANEAKLFYTWARTLYNSKRFREATKIYQKSVEIGPDLHRAYCDWGVALQSLSHHDEALEILSRVPGSSPDYWKAIYFSANVLLDQKKYREAVEYYERASQIKPERGLIHADWGVALTAQKEYEAAHEHYEKAIHAPEPSLEAYGLWLDSLYGNGQYREVVKLGLAALEKVWDPGSLKILVNALDKLKESERSDNISRLEALLERAPYGADVFCEWGRILSGKERYEESIRRFRSAIDRYPQHFGAYVQWGITLSMQGRHQDAIQKYRTAVKLKPESFPALHNWAHALYSLRNYVEAVEKYLTAIQLQPNSVDYVRWIKALEKLDSEDARYFTERLDQFLKKNPRKAEAYHQWGEALRRRRHFAAAIELYQKAVTIKPNFAEAYNSCGRALLEQSENEEAIKFFTRAVEIRRDLYYSHLNLGLSFNRREETDEAVKHFEAAVRENPDDAHSYNAWAVALVKQKNYKQAAENFIKAMEIDPRMVNYQAWTTVLDELELSERANFVKAFQDLAGRNPVSIELWKGWGYALASLRRFEEAQDKFRTAIKMQPTNYEAYYGLGNVLVNMRDFEQAIEAFKKATSLNPEFVDGFFSWAYALSEQKKSAEALALYEKTTTLGPDFSFAYHNIANAYWRQGKYRVGREKWESARRVYERTTEGAREAGNPDHFAYYGSVLHEIFGDLAAAESVYLQGLEIDPDHALILFGLMNLYLEKKDEKWAEREEDAGEQATTYFWKARNLSRQLENILKRQIAAGADVRSELFLAQLYLTMEDYDEADKTLSSIVQSEGGKVAETYVLLGFLYTRREDFKKGIENFERALQLDPYDLSTRSNLAEAHLKEKRYEKAVEQYHRILSVTSEHIESLIGLGQVYIALGEKGDAEMFEDAIRHLLEAINLAQSGQGSKRLKKKDLAAVFYSCGYARVNLYESAKVVKDESLLRKALEDFRNCDRLDCRHEKANRALKKIESRLARFASQRGTEKWGRVAVIALSIGIFGLAVASFFFKWPTDAVDGKYCVMMTFGALIFIIAGLYLPQLLKLKVAGIELEKSTVDQFSTAGTLGISK